MTEDNQQDESLDSIFEDYADHQSDNYIDFEKFLAHYRGDLSKNTLVTYGRALKFMDFDPSSDSPKPECLDEDEKEKFDIGQFESLWARRKMKEVVGKGQGKRPTRNRQAYLCWLGLKKYFKAIGEADKIDELPSSDEFNNKKSSGGSSKKKDEDNNSYEKVRLKEHQVRKMMDAADEKIEAVLICLYFGGMRSFELLNTTHSWFDFTKEEKIKVRIPAEYAKGKRGNRDSESLLIKKEFQEELQNFILKVHGCEEKDYKEFLKENEDSKYLFNFKKETEKNFKDLVTERWRLWEELRYVANEKTSLDKEYAENLSSHDFRGSHIERVYDTIKDLKKTASVARHGSSETTEKYYLQEDKEEKLDTYKQAFEEND
jgi:integrase